MESDKQAGGLKCNVCEQRVTFADVGLLEQVTPDVYHVVWQCGCGVREQTGRFTQRLLRRLLGDFRPQLPYTACPLPSAVLSDVSECLVGLLSGLLTCVDDVGDFVELCTIDSIQASEHEHGDA